MEIPRGRRRLVPVIYGGAVLFLFVVALFIRGFSRDVGDARVAGRFTLAPLYSSRALEELTLSWNGFALHFSRSSQPGLTGFDAEDGMTDIVLAGGQRLRLTPGKDVGGSLTVTPVNTGVASRGQLLVPFTLAGVLTVIPEGATLAWRSEGKTYLLSLPASARVDTDAHTISLPMDGSAWSAGFSVSGTPAVASTPSTAIPAATRRPARLPDEKSLPSAEKLQTALNAWSDAAYAGWTGARFFADSAQWRLSNGRLGVPESLGVALLAESVARGTWQNFFPLWADALAGQQQRAGTSSTTFATSSFVGGTREFARVNSARTTALVDQASGLLAASDNALLRTRGWVGLLLDHGTPDLLTASLAFMTGRKVSSLDVPSAVGLLEALVEQSEKIGQTDAVRRALQDVTSRRILAAIRPTDAGLFLESTAAAVDVADDTRCGALLLRAGAILGDTRLSALGRGLLVAALGLSDGAGMMPQALRLSSTGIASRSGSLAPEDVYDLLPTDRFLPREISLARQVGAGVSIWTAAEVTANRTGGTLQLVLAYPARVPHYFVIQGIGAFSEVLVHGIPWHADPDFARYPNGWSYDGGVRMFHGKLTGRTDREEIDITF